MFNYLYRNFKPHIAGGIMALLLSLPIFGVVALIDSSGVYGWLIYSFGCSGGAALGIFIATHIFGDA